MAVVRHNRGVKGASSMALETPGDDRRHGRRRIAWQATLVSGLLVLTILNLVLSPSKPATTQTAAARGPVTSAPPPTTLPTGSVPTAPATTAPATGVVDQNTTASGAS